jgi:hypothetical protein
MGAASGLIKFVGGGGLTAARGACRSYGLVNRASSGLPRGRSAGAATGAVNDFRA